MKCSINTLCYVHGSMTLFIYSAHDIPDVTFSEVRLWGWRILFLCSRGRSDAGVEKGERGIDRRSGIGDISVTFLLAEEFTASRRCAEVEDEDEDEKVYYPPTRNNGPGTQLTGPKADVKVQMICHESVTSQPIIHTLDKFQLQLGSSTCTHFCQWRING